MIQVRACGVRDKLLEQLELAVTSGSVGVQSDDRLAGGGQGGRRMEEEDARRTEGMKAGGREEGRRK